MPREAYDTTEHEQKVLNEGRLLRAEADIFLPMLRQQREIAISKIIHVYKAGGEGLQAAAASLVAIEDMLTTTGNKIKKAEVIERKIHGSGE